MLKYKVVPRFPCNGLSGEKVRNENTIRDDSEFTHLDDLIFTPCSHTPLFSNSNLETGNSVGTHCTYNHSYDTCSLYTSPYSPISLIRSNDKYIGNRDMDLSYGDKINYHCLSNTSTDAFIPIPTIPTCVTLTLPVNTSAPLYEICKLPSNQFNINV